MEQEERKTQEPPTDSEGQRAFDFHPIQLGLRFPPNNQLQD